MLTDAEKEIFLNWQRWKIHHDVMTSMEAFHVETIEKYFAAVDKLKTIQNERIAALVKAAYEDAPDGELTVAFYQEWKLWKVKTDAAQNELLTASFEFGSTIPRA
jgi:hypothetical protein